jgi:filamentous hemagglutinin family protein
MIVAAAARHRADPKALRRGASSIALVAMLLQAPVGAQTAAILRASQGLTTPVITPSAVLARPAPVAPNVAGMTSASARALANQAAAANATSLAVQANSAARATAQALAQTIPNGLVAGGLVPVANGTLAALDPTGLKTWQGALAPVQTGSAAAPTVTITQTAQRALLTWESFNVGRATTLVFNQQPDWVVLNRIVANIDPRTGRIADAANLRPSQILGTIKADGTVLVINQNGVMFGATAQVNVRSLLVSSLEIGTRSRETQQAGGTLRITVPTSLSDRGISFLQSGLIAADGSLVSAVVLPNPAGTNVIEPSDNEGDVSIAAGANIASNPGGYVIIAAPRISNAGEIRSPEGQVSLQSGRRVFATPSSGSADSIDPEIRGLVLSSIGQTADSVTNAATGLIEAARGYVSIGTTVSGRVSTAGVINATTSVSRNGKIVLTGAEVTVAPGATIAITPDTNGETIPQGQSSVASFQSSVINIGGATDPGVVTPSQIIIGKGALIYAPSARVSIGATNDARTVSVFDDSLAPASSLLVDTGAIIDVGGIKDLVVPASRNSVQITPVKRNELRDTPNYRETTDDGSFTLNGTTLFVDPRLSGVRADGVAWIGSPLIEAGSFFAQVGITAAELMTRGGNLTLGVRSFGEGSLASVPLVTVSSGAILDVSGGWVRYEDGIVATSRLRTADGRLVEIGKADPNDNFVGIVSPITAEQPRFGFSTTFGTAAQASGFESGYTEGRDAGSLTIKASTNVLAGTIYGNAFAGTRQIADAKTASKPSAIDSDLRRLQSAPSQLPSGGLLKIAAIGTETSDQAGGADIIVYRAGGTVPARRASEILLSDTFLSGSGLSQVALQTSGRVDFQTGSALTLAAGGALLVDAGRSIRFDGSVVIASGTIRARTFEVLPGSVFRDDDNLPPLLAENAATPRFFDITVNGLLSVRGSWTNDFLVNDGVYLGSAYTNGGSVSLQVAPRVLIPIGETPTFSADFSGSLLVNATARIDVSAGGYVRPDGTLVLNSKGGDVALINETIYGQVLAQPLVQPGLSDRSVTVEVPSFITTPNPSRRSGLAPRVAESQVFLAPGTIVAQGFTGGGAFTLVTPKLNFGARSGATGTAIPLDFVTSTGFANVSLSSYTSRFFGPRMVNGTEVNGIFANGINGSVALLDTTVLTIGAGETLNLTQSLIETLPTDEQADAVRQLANGGDIRALLGTAVPTAEWDRRPVGFTLGGLTELDVLSGGLVTGSAGASLTLSKLYNQGTIRIAGGLVRQDARLIAALVDGQRPALGVSGLPGVDGLATIFGARDANGLFDETAANSLGITGSSTPGVPILSNANLVGLGTVSRPIFLTATLGANEGIRIAPEGVMDLSGTSIRNPRADARPGGNQKIDGRVVDGGVLETATRFVGAGTVLVPVPKFGIARFVDPFSGSTVPIQTGALRLTAAAGSTIDLRGAADRYDLETSLGVFTLSPVWSNGGRLSIGGTGSLGGSRIFADGGAAAAEGGVLTWLNPVLSQNDTPNQPVNVVSANQITAAGFDTLVAQDRLTTLGDVTLRLGRGFYLTARDYDGDSMTLNSYRTTLSTTGNLRIEAPYIHLGSPQQTVLPVAAASAAGGEVTLAGRTIDIIGSVYADASVRKLTLDVTGDVRLTGVQPPILTVVGGSSLPVPSGLAGQFVVNGDLTIKAAQVYPTTGTGSLQQEINAQRAGTSATAAPYLIASTGASATIRFSRSSDAIPATPYSAGGNLLVQAANIVQDGVIRVPLGRLVLGANTPLTIGSSLIPLTVPATRSLRLGASGITSVSAGGLNIPYGETTDLIEFFFTPTSDGRLFAPPAAELRLSGDSVIVATGATVDASGGGDLYAYEFAAGVGGSRDVLSRFNSDAFSGNNGLQFADGRQVYAIIPGANQDSLAPIDPLYSADYQALYGTTDAGRSVYLEAAAGLAAGWYTLLPARYALLPGGMRVVENTGDAPPAIGESATLRDGSIVVGGRYGVAGSPIESSQRRTFTVQSQATLRKFSNIQLTQASSTFADLARRDGLAVPQLPADAARLVLAPLTELAINTRFLTAPATGGRGAQVDISGNAFEIVVPGAPASPLGTIRLTTTDFTNLNAASLLIGGFRTDKADGTTTIFSTTRSILIANTAANPLTAPEIILVTDGFTTETQTDPLGITTTRDIGSTITIADGAVLTATGQLVDTRAGNYVITASTQTGQTAVGGVVRVANGPQRLLSRPGELALANSLIDSSITIGEATLTGTAILLDNSRDLVITDNPLTAAIPRITATNSLALSGDDIFFTTAPSGYRGLVITPALEAQFAASENLVITTKSIIGFAGGTYNFRNLTIDARGIRPYGQATTPPPMPRQDQVDVPVADPNAPIAVTINANSFAFSNTDVGRTPCDGVGTVNACGATGNSLVLNATEVRLGSGPMGIFGFDASVRIASRNGVFVEGVGTLDIGIADLDVQTPFFGDRALSADPRGTKEQPSLGVFTKGLVRLAGTRSPATPAVAAAPGATLAFGSIDRPVEAFSADGLELRASAGVLDVRSTGSITITGAAVLATPGYSKSFGDEADRVIVSAPGGILNLVSLAGDVDLGPAVLVSVGGGSGAGGALQLSAAQGRVVLPGRIDAAALNGKASLRIDSGTAAIDLQALLVGQGKDFTGNFVVRTGVGNLVLGNGQLLRADSVRLTADDGLVDIAGTIDTSGINGGSIGLFGTDGVALRATARIDATADGYGAKDTRAAAGGTVAIGTAGTGRIDVANGAVITVAALRPGARIIEQIRKDALTLNDTITYNYAQSDTGGVVTFRAPVIFDANNNETVAINYAGSITGARDVSVEGYRVYDLATLALATGCTGADICINAGGQAVLNVNAKPTGRANILSAIAPGTIPDFVRNFDLTASANGLGTLAADPNFHARPGIQIEFVGDIILASNWNLGAATVNQAAALADGLMARSPQLGNAATYVVPGSEAALFSGFSTSAQAFYTDFTYRVGGRASGEAGVLTLRAGGNLDIRGSITDGFFNFSDRTDPAYLSFQLGGGDRKYRPALELTCSAPAISCAEVFNPFFFAPGANVPPGVFADIINIPINRLQRGQEGLDIFGPPVAPYSAAANSPGALGSQADGAGDPIGSATIAPLLADGSAAESFSLRLVGGALPDGAMTLRVSADPTAVAVSSKGNVSVSGETTYRATPIVQTQAYAGDLQLTNFDPSLGQDIAAAPADFAAALAALSSSIEPTNYTRLTLTGASAANRSFFVNAARAYFAANQIPADQYQFFGPANNPTVIAGSFDLISRVLQSISVGFASQIALGRINYPPPTTRPVTNLANPNIAVRSLVRTGTGSIDVAAAGDVDLTNGRPVFRTANGRVTSSGAVSGAQTGGTSIYTAGHRVDPSALSATETATGRVVSINPAFTAAPVASANFLPNLQGVLDGEPVYAGGGGDIRIVSGRDVLARRDAWAESFRGGAAGNPPTAFANAGTDTQLWRQISGPITTNAFAPITNIRINAQLFSSGIGALGGGSVEVSAARNISELTVVSDTSITTAQVRAADRPGAAPALALISYGGGDVSLRAGGSVRGGEADVASGSLTITAGGDVGSAGLLRVAGSLSSPMAPLEENLLRVRVADGTAGVSAIRSITVGGIASTDGEGFFSQSAGVSLASNGDVRLLNAGKDIVSIFSTNNSISADQAGALLPGSLSVAALFGNIDLSDLTLRELGARRRTVVLVPSPVGQLRLFAGGDLAPVTLAMDDGDPSLTPGPLSALTRALLADINAPNLATRRFGFPVILPDTSDNDRRKLHNERPTHAGDHEPVRIAADGNINAVTLSLPKQARISAGGNIVDMIFIGQNLAAGDVTRITAGGDIIASSRVLPVATAAGGTANLPVQQGNNFVLGGPGALFVEAGRDLGPFFNSAIVRDGAGRSSAYAGGILTVGNDHNPWLTPVGAKLYAQFGVGKGADYNALRTTFVDPANASKLDGDLFVQAFDSNGNRLPDRTKPIYASALVGWLVENQPDAITAAFGAPIPITAADVLPLLNSLDAAVRTQFLVDLPYLPIGGGLNSPTVAIDRSVAAAPLLLTGAGVADAPSGQRTTISGGTLIGWLAQNAPSVLVSRYRVTSTDIGRAYSALTTLSPLTQRQFLLDRVYFNELAAPSRPDGASSGQFIRGYRAVDLLFPGTRGYTANDLGGTTNGGKRVLTGNLDLRLATLETQRGGDVTILGPGGRVLGGSVVATSAQAARRGANVADPFNLFRGVRRLPTSNDAAARIFDIPIGFEGVLTLRGGSVRGFTDGDFLLNQSRLFTLSGGDVTLWSSNGDLNAGQGAKTSANNPPVVVRFDPNGVGTLDQAGTVAGAGIAALQPAGVDKAPDVTLIAPVGTVDAGDAGVRASGNVFVAAARVANADNFKVGGTAFGNIATTSVDTGAAASANAASAAASQAAAAVNPTGGRAGNDQSRISVDVLGFAGNAGDDPCNKPEAQRPTNCPVTRN